VSVAVNDSPLWSLQSEGEEGESDEEDEDEEDSEEEPTQKKGLRPSSLPSSVPVKLRHLVIPFCF